ncbi:MAG: oxidoreductase [Ectobacillus sp.]
MDRIALVTGASSGFGLLVSLELALCGFQVIATMRNIEKQKLLLAEAKALGVDHLITVYKLDVTCNDSIKEMELLLGKIGRIDVLVNNAGYASGGFVEEIPLEEYKKQFDTNVFGAIAVTQAALPIMRKQQSGKIINISSISGKVAFPGLSPYVASKHALEGWSECLRLEVKPFGVDVVLVEPGSYKTNIWSSGKQVAKASLLPESPYYQTMKKIESHLEQGAGSFGDPRDVAKKIARIAEQKHPTLRYPIGKGVKFAVLLKNAVSWKVWETFILSRLK